MKLPKLPLREGLSGDSSLLFDADIDVVDVDLLNRELGHLRKIALAARYAVQSNGSCGDMVALARQVSEGAAFVPERIQEGSYENLIAG